MSKRSGIERNIELCIDSLFSHGSVSLDILQMRVVFTDCVLLDDIDAQRGLVIGTTVAKIVMHFYRDRRWYALVYPRADTPRDDAVRVNFGVQWTRVDGHGKRPAKTW